jgi:hypothetical protein
VIQSPRGAGRSSPPLSPLRPTASTSVLHARLVPFPPLWYPVCKEEKWRLFFLFFFLIRVMRFGNLEFVESIHLQDCRISLVSCLRRGRELLRGQVGHWTLIRLISLPLTLAALSLIPPSSLCSRPSPLFHLLPPQNPSRRPPPHSLPPPPRCIPLAWFSVVWLRSQLEFGGRKKEGGREDPKVNLWLTFVVFVLQSIWLCVYLCESVEVLSWNFVSGWTTVVLGISGNFRGLISDNQYDNHVGLCLIFPMSTYALNL